MRSDDASRSQALWSTLYGREVTDAEHSEIEQNLSGFLTLLDEWDRTKTVPANDDKMKGRHEDNTNLP